MNPLRYRQVHLDFHTSEHVPSVGNRFDKIQFQNALKTGHVDSITVFSKCHHGWSYHPTNANIMHPKLNFDLLGAQLEACREIDVKAPVYISAGFDEKYAREHPDELNMSAPDSEPRFDEAARYHLLCYNTPYLDTLVSQIEEVMEKYNPCGIFLDISSTHICYCKYCIEGMKKQGLNPDNMDDMILYGEKVYADYCKRTQAAVRKYSSTATIFHNSGHIAKGRRDIAGFNTHLELESLPTGGWGYDHFPMSAAYARTLGMEFLGMTGKFHLSWGEFGGYKHPNALRYETALSVASGAKCSIGDQLHPTGEMNEATYRLIGSAYSEVEAKLPYLENAVNVSDVAVLSTEAFAGKADMHCPQDTGAARMLLEGKILFDIIDMETDFDSYKLLILPDKIKADDKLSDKLKKYISDGGKILASGESLLSENEDRFAIDFSAEYLGKNEFTPSYMIPCYESVNGETAYVMYSDSQKIISDSKIKALIRNPYFNRTPEHFCSHQHTPDNDTDTHTGAVINGNVGYISWNIFEDYAVKGSYHLKELVLDMIHELLPERSLETNLPDRGVTTLTSQGNRYIAHLLFAHTTVRGRGVEIIEDIVPVSNVTLKVRLPFTVSEVYKIECEEGKTVKTPLEFTSADNVTSVSVESVKLHSMIVFEKQ